MLPGKSLNPTGGRFLTTNWSLVAHAALEESSPEGQAALSQLYSDYWPPVYTFIRQRGHERADAEDLSQDFFLYLMEQHAFAKADSFKGRFRSFLLGWLKNFLLKAQELERRLKRGGNQTFIFLDAEIDALESLRAKELMVRPPGDEEKLFEWQWATVLVRRTMKALEIEQAGKAKMRVLNELRPFLEGGAGLPSQTEAADRLGLPVETLRSHLSRLRSRYRALLRQEVTRTVADESDVDEELRFLYRILAASSFEPPL